MKKRIFALTLAASLMLTACGTVKETTTTSDSKNETTTEATTTTISETTEATPTPIPSVYTIKDDYVIFGHYEQDGDTSNGPEPIEWVIVSKENGKMLLMSRYYLEWKPFNDERTKTTWEECSLRKWLNNDFINSAFSSAEQEKILSTKLTTPDNAFDGAKGGNDTEDKVFCLSIDEVLANFKPWEDGFGPYNEKAGYGVFINLESKPTVYALSQSGERPTGYGFWLRTMAGDNTKVCVASGSAGSSVNHYVEGNINDPLVFVRPVLYLSVE